MGKNSHSYLRIALYCRSASGTCLVSVCLCVCVCLGGGGRWLLYDPVNSRMIDELDGDAHV
jgi:hypothetical protein